MPVAVRFRRLVDDDLPMLHRWLNEPGVVRWWEGDDVSVEGVRRDYGSQSTERTEYWIALIDGEEIGWIQCYAIADYPEEDEVQQWRRLGVDETCAGIDYLIADPGRRRRGLGTAMISAFVRDIVFGRHPTWNQVGASPVAANTASWRALEKAGFRAAGEFDSEHGRCKLMLAARA